MGSRRQGCGTPAGELLGGRRLDRVPVHASEVMPDTTDEVRALAEAAVAGGYSAFKLGWRPLGLAADNDVGLITAARQALGPEPGLISTAGWPARFAAPRACSTRPRRAADVAGGAAGRRRLRGLPAPGGALRHAARRRRSRRHDHAVPRAGPAATSTFCNRTSPAVAGSRSAGDRGAVGEGRHRRGAALLLHRHPRRRGDAFRGRCRARSCRSSQLPTPRSSSNCSPSRSGCTRERWRSPRVRDSASSWTRTC